MWTVPVNVKTAGGVTVPLTRKPTPQLRRGPSLRPQTRLTLAALIIPTGGPTGEPTTLRIAAPTG